MAKSTKKQRTGGAMSVALALLFGVRELSHPHSAEIVLICLALWITLNVALWDWAQSSSIQVGKIFRLPILFGLTGLTVWAIGWYCWPQPPKVLIQVDMAISPADPGEKSTFNFDLQNLSDVGAKITNYRMSTDNAVDITNPPIGPYLAPHAHERIPPPPWFVLEKKWQNVYLDMTFVPDQGESKTELFRFLLKPEDVHPGLIYQYRMFEIEGAVESANPLMRNADLNRLMDDLNFGTSSVVIDEKVEGRLNFVRFSDGTKSFLFDPRARTVTWKVKSFSGRTTKRSLSLTNKPSGQHLIILIWNAANGSCDLVVDQSHAGSTLDENSQ